MFSNPLPVRHMSPGAQQDLRSQRGSARGTANCGQNSHLIGLSFKYLTQDNHRQEKRLPFLVLNFFKQIRETAVKLRFSPQGMQDKTCYGTKKSKYKSWMAGDCEMVGVLILGIQSLDRAGQASCQSLQFVTVGPCGSGQTVQKSGMCLPGSPLGTQLRRGGP